MVEVTTSRAVKIARLTASAVSAGEAPADQYGIVPAPLPDRDATPCLGRRIRRLRLRPGLPPTMRSSHC
jgi:hypothetical protein